MERGTASTILCRLRDRSEGEVADRALYEVGFVLRLDDKALPALPAGQGGGLQETCGCPGLLVRLPRAASL